MNSRQWQCIIIIIILCVLDAVKVYYCACCCPVHLCGTLPRHTLMSTDARNCMLDLGHARSKKWLSCASHYVINLRGNFARG